MWRWPTIIAEQYHKDQLPKEIKQDITDDILRTFEENKCNKANRSYNIHMQPEINVAQPNRMDSMWDKNIYDGQIDTINKQEDSKAKTQAQDTILDNILCYKVEDVMYDKRYAHMHTHPHASAKYI